MSIVSSDFCAGQFVPEELSAVADLQTGIPAIAKCARLAVSGQIDILSNHPKGWLDKGLRLRLGLVRRCEQFGLTSSLRSAPLLSTDCPSTLRQWWFRLRRLMVAILVGPDYNQRECASDRVASWEIVA
jgi:hypothetical protein